MEEQFSEAARSWWTEAEANAQTRSLLAAPAAMTASLDASSLSAQAIARSFSSWRSGCPRLRGDWQTLREVFLDKFASHNGEVRVATAKEINTAWGKVTSVQLDDGEEIGLTQLALAMPIDEFAVLMGPKAAKKVGSHLDAVRLGGYRYVLNLVVHEAGVPEGMGSQAFYVGDPTAPLEGDNALAIFVTEPDDEACVVVTVEASCPVQDDVDTDTTFADLRVRIRERLEEIMPFVSDHIVAVHSPHEAVAAEGLSEELELSEVVPPQPLWHCDLDSTLGLSALPYHIGLKNVTLASSQVLPGMGLEAHFATGWCAAKLILQTFGKKRDAGRHQVISDSRR
jgi:hypothetical protein